MNQPVQNLQRLVWGGGSVAYTVLHSKSTEALWELSQAASEVAGSKPAVGLGYGAVGFHGGVVFHSCCISLCRVAVSSSRAAGSEPGGGGP